METNHLPKAEGPLSAGGVPSPTATSQRQGGGCFWGAPQQPAQGTCGSRPAGAQRPPPSPPTPGCHSRAPGGEHPAPTAPRRRHSGPGGRDPGCCPRPAASARPEGLGAFPPARRPAGRAPNAAGGGQGSRHHGAPLSAAGGARPPGTHLTLAATDDMASFLSVFLLDTAVPIFAQGGAAGRALIARPRGCPCRGGAGCRGAPPPLAAALPQRPAMPRRPPPRPAPPRCPRRVLRSAAAAASSLTAAGGRARARPAAQEAPLYLAGGSLLRPRLLPADIMAGGGRRPRRRGRGGRWPRPGGPRGGQLAPAPAAQPLGSRVRRRPARA